jgi:alpha-glucosidase (family GH31 glycosyl hydrolase)
LYDYRDFTYDKEGSFANLSNFVDGLHKKNMQWIPIIDAGIAARSNPQQDGQKYEVFEDGLKEDIFIKT